MMGQHVASTSPLWRKIEQNIQAKQFKPVEPVVVANAETAFLCNAKKDAGSLIDAAFQKSQQIPIADIARRVCWLFGISESDLQSSSRNATLVKARSYAVFLMCRHSTISTVEMGRFLGGRDHTTIMHLMRVMSIKRNVRLRGMSPDRAQEHLAQKRVRDMIWSVSGFAEVRQMMRSGMTTLDIAKRWGCTEARVYNILCAGRSAIEKRP